MKMLFNYFALISVTSAGNGYRHNIFEGVGLPPTALNQRVATCAHSSNNGHYEIFTASNQYQCHSGELNVFLKKIINDYR